MRNLWYKNAIVYCVDIDAFQDSDADGCGDFRGLADQLDHIESLGATCIWLLPFYPTPDRDNGYDITDYYGVDPRLGTLGDFVEFSHAARDRGLKVIVDLVVNHTSVDHPWFQASREGHPKYRDWYIWRDEKPEDADEGVIFPGVQESTWTYDRKRRAYYFHRFYRHQADLNIANPAVREEIERVIGFWLALGVSGFRIDAVPFILEDLRGDGSQSPYAYLSEMRRFLGWRRAEAILLAEANIEVDQSAEFFGDGDRLNLIFNFPLNQRLFLAFARGEAEPIEALLKELPEKPEVSQWATFLRNHDELDLGRLSESERQEVFAAFGPDKDMQIYERGIRRRLAPMLGGDARRIAMAYSLMLSLPGTPVLWYGDEIGMGENLALPERQAVRTPMQWSAATNGGFSDAEPEACVREPVSEGPFAPAHVNAESQWNAPDSLFSIVQKLVRSRRRAVEIGWAPPVLIETGEPAVVAMTFTWRGMATTTYHNLSERPITVTAIDLQAYKASHVVASGDGLRDWPSGEPLRLDPYGFVWVRYSAEAAEAADAGRGRQGLKK